MSTVYQILNSSLYSLYSLYSVGSLQLGLRRQQCKFQVYSFRPPLSPRKFSCKWSDPSIPSTYRGDSWTLFSTCTAILIRTDGVSQIASILVSQSIPCFRSDKLDAERKGAAIRTTLAYTFTYTRTYMYSSHRIVCATKLRVPPNTVLQDGSISGKGCCDDCKIPFVEEGS